MRRSPPRGRAATRMGVGAAAAKDPVRRGQREKDEDEEGDPRPEQQLGGDDQGEVADADHEESIRVGLAAKRILRRHGAGSEEVHGRVDHDPHMLISVVVDLELDAVVVLRREMAAERTRGRD